MKTEIVYKDAFAVIGKMGCGPESNPQAWILPLWEAAMPNFPEIAKVVRTDEHGFSTGVWGAMNDADEQNKRWNGTGKYMAGCEADVNAVAPQGWSKWIIPAQTYLVASCTMDAYGDVFGTICAEEGDNIIATVHERYPDPNNPNLVELYFPIAAGMLICQCCAMPMTTTAEFGTEADGSPNRDYCTYCYQNGSFGEEKTMEEVIEICIPFSLEAGLYKDAESARKAMMQYFPTLKRWAKK